MDSPIIDQPKPVGDGRPRLLLASRSPRRRALLNDFGVRHVAEHPGFDDATLVPGRVSPEQWVAALAYLKASAGVDMVPRSSDGSSDYVLGADTLCVKHGHILGTPMDADEARGILRELAGGEHRVLTGVAIIEVRNGEQVRRHVFTEQARVKLGVLSEEQIEEYVASGAWAGKAGAYNLAERLEAGWPIEYAGDPTTIMGLPMRALVPRLRKVGAMQAEMLVDMPEGAE